MNIIAIDGPSGVGKGTIAASLAAILNYDYLDTGVFYRAIAYLKIKNNLKEEELPNYLKSMNIEFINNKVILNNEDVTIRIREYDVTLEAAKVSVINELRIIINEKIRNYCKDKNIVVDGRDISTVVFPEANYKFFITANLNTRIERRFNQLKDMGINSNINDVEKSIKVRDEIESTREYGKLLKSDDAYLIDTTDKTSDECVTEILNIINK